MPVLERALRDRYLGLLGADVRRADERALARLLEAHLEHVPVENLGALVARRRAETEGRRALVPDAARIVDTADRLGAGGRAFEIAVALRALLDGLGFDAFLMSADAAPHFQNHLAVGVRLGSATYLCDAGMGAPARQPMPLEPAGPPRSYDAGYCAVRVVPGVNEYEVWLRWGGAPEVLAYRLDPEPIGEDEAIEMTVRSFDPGAGFPEDLSARACRKNGSVFALNRSLEVRTTSGVIKDKLESAEAYARAVRDQIGIDGDFVLDAWRALAARGVDPFAGGPLVPW